MTMYVKLGSITLTSGSYRLTREIDLGEVARSFVDMPSLPGAPVAQRAYDGGVVEQPIHLRVYGGMANWNAIVAELEKETNLLEVMAPDSATAVTFRSFRSVPPHVVWPPGVEALDRFDVDFNVRREAWGSAALQTVRSYAALTVPAAVSLASMTGVCPTPVVLRCERTGTGAINALWVAWGPDSAWTGWMQECEALTWTGGTATTTADTNARGGSMKRVTALLASPALTTIADAAFPAGTYKLLVRAKATTQSGFVKHEFVAAYTTVPVSASYVTYDLGEVVLPAHPSRGSLTSKLNLSAYVTSGGSLDLDYFALLPAEQCTWLDGTSASADKVYLDYPAVYLNDTVDYAKTIGCGICALGGQVIIVPALGAVTGGQISCDVGVTSYPHYYHGA